MSQLESELTTGTSAASEAATALTAAESRVAELGKELDTSRAGAEAASQAAAVDLKKANQSLAAQSPKKWREMQARDEMDALKKQLDSEAGAKGDIHAQLLAAQSQAAEQEARIAALIEVQSMRSPAHFQSPPPLEGVQGEGGGIRVRQGRVGGQARRRQSRR